MHSEQQLNLLNQVTLALMDLEMTVEIKLDQVLGQVEQVVVEQVQQDLFKQVKQV
jgi:hypothetical protein